ncbi:MAG: PHP domain-containing protein [bacterium]|nr:MAG: PHP domain-containing protein [bacterium]
MYKKGLHTFAYPKVDLHIHSDRSDGSFTCKEIIDYACKLGLKAISITDHDDISSMEFSEKYCQQKGIEFITGVEISARSKPSDLHLLGYFFDYHNKHLNEYIDFFQNERLKRARKIVKLLKNYGIKLTFDLILKKARHGSIGRPHIADAMVEEGCVYTYQEAFNKYIGDRCPCFVPKYKISPAEAIALINNAGGICVIAHPGTDVTDEGLMDLIKVGLEGIETIHPRHTQQQVDHYREIIQKHGLLETGGSDCHGDRKSYVMIGQFNIPYSIVEKMKAWLGRRKSSAV